jgi:ABC-type oligopeptide transport system ATPase subunit
MSVIGSSGSGKSSVMAQVVKLNEDREGVVIYRFIGSTSRSTNIMSLLQSLCLQIANKFGTEDPKTLGHDEKAWSDMNGLADIFRKCLALAKPEKPLLLFIDSLDQLSDTDNAKALYWLPKELPDHVSVVVSALSELEEKLSETIIAYVPILPEKEAIEILDQWLKSVNRQLTGDQTDLVIKSFKITPLPLYLKLAFEKAKKWHSYDNPHSLKPDVQGIINEYFDDLEKEFPEDFVKTAICYMLSGRYMGLAENEILEILAFDPEYWQKFLNTSHDAHRKELENLKHDLDNPKEGPAGYMKIPIAVWSRLYFELEPFLTERDADGVPIITFFHRQFNKVLRERYDLKDSRIQN